MIITKLYGGKITLNFEEVPYHRFTINGRRIVSVTGATEIIDKSRPLMIWAVRLAKEFLMEKKIWKITDKGETLLLIEEAGKQHTIRKKKAADIGKQIHEWIEGWIKKKNPDIPENEKVRNGVIAFLKWQKKHKAKFIESEKIVYSKKYDYAGICDAVATIKGKKYIIDFKSSNRIYNEHRYQLAGYWLALEEMTGKKFDGGLIIRFGKDTGEFENSDPITRDEYEKNKEAFLGALTIKKREKELTIN